MENDEVVNSSDKTAEVGVDSQFAVNSLILDYYKKFGRKRDLEQFFSLSTAQSDIKDPSSSFWRKMKNENDSSDSEGRKSESSREICRISIKCSVPESCSSQDEDPSKTKTDSVSPPIIVEEVPTNTSRQTDEESVKSDDNNSHRSFDALLLDTSTQKPFSPTSSITSQRKLEWDSLADVGYANEGDRKTSASSLSTLERLALHQQYSNNDTKENIGPPTSHSTPLDENDKLKSKKGMNKKTTRIHKKDIDVVEVNVPSTSEIKPNPSISVNLTKHISFNVEKDGGVTIDNMRKDISVSPEKHPAENTGITNNIVGVKSDKEIQTSLIRTHKNSITPVRSPKAVDPNARKIPIMISVNTLRKKLRRKKSKAIRRRFHPRKKINVNKDNLRQEKTGVQLSEAESFEYMPGHIYNQNRMKNHDERPANTSAGNKSSLESSGVLTTDSSKGSKHSFTKDLDKSIKLLKDTLQKRYVDSEVKNKLIKEVVSRLLRSRYRDDDDSGEFLSGLSFSSRKIGLKHGSHTTTSTSDANMTEDNTSKRPKKSILRVEKFNPNAVASSSQSAPNLLIAANSNKVIASNLSKAIITNTESDVSSRGKNSSDNVCPKTSSEELYQKYLEALKREETYKKHLKDKELFLKKKLTSSDSAFKVPTRQEVKVNYRIKDLMKDLTRNNYDDGSGDASKLEGGSNSNISFERFRAIQNQRSHSVFTLSSSPSDCPKKPNLKKKHCDIRDLNEAGPSSKHPDHYCCCPHHHANSRVGYVDSSVQVNIKCQYDETCSQKFKKSSLLPIDCNTCKESPRKMGQVIADNETGDIKYVCLCNEKPVAPTDIADNFMIYKCSRLKNRGVQLDDTPKISDMAIQCGDSYKVKSDNIKLIRPPSAMTDNESSSSDNFPYKKQSKSSQTNLLVKMLCRDGSDTNTCFSDGKTSKDNRPISPQHILSSDSSRKNFVHEATRCLQTEISINPKITDPSLADINIVNDYECAKLIHEQYRKVSQTCSSKNGSSQKTKDCIVESESSEFGKNSFKCENKFKDKHYVDSKDLNTQCVTLNKDEFTIPIQGTNMTLMVNLGAVEIKKAKHDNVDQACVTDKANIVEQATCILEECSKSIQYESPGFTCPSAIDINSNKVTKETSTQGESDKKSIATSIGNTGIKSNTYPKKLHPNIRKPLCRSNTDTDKIEKIGFMQTDTTKDCKIAQKVIYPEDAKAKIASQCDTEYKPPKYKPEINQCPRGDCENKIMEDQFCKKDTGTQKDLPICSPKKYEKDYPSSSCNNSEKIELGSNDQRSSKNVCCEEPNLVQPNELECGSEENQKNCTLATDADLETSANNFGIGENVGTAPELKQFAQKCRCVESSTKNIYNEQTVVMKNQMKKPSPKLSSESENSNKITCGDAKDLRSSSRRSKSPPKCVCGSEKLLDNNYRAEKNDHSQSNDSSPSIVSKDSEKITKNNCDSTQENCNFPKLKKPSLKCSCGFENLSRNCSESQDNTRKPHTISCDCDKSSKCGVDRKSVGVMAKSKEPIQPSTSSNDGGTNGVQGTYSGDQQKDPILDMIREITKQYSKTDIQRYKKKKCFKEIMTVLHYLLETDDSEVHPNTGSCTTAAGGSQEKLQDDCCAYNKAPEKSVRASSDKCKGSNAKISVESSDIPASSDLPFTSSDSATCKVLNKIKKECEKYHQKRCKSGRKCYSSSTTSVNCDQCKSVHYCFCKSHKCRKSRTATDKLQKCVAYNLIIQTSESILSEEKPCDKKSRPLQNIVVKVPKSKPFENICKETSCKKETVYKVEKPRCSPRCGNRSRSCPNESEMSSTEEFLRKTQQCTVREYLEKNRPDFVDNCTQRQSCLKYVSDVRANERSAKRDLLSLHVERQPDLTGLRAEELRCLAAEIGLDLRRRRPAPNFISEREMKKHTEDIYKTLPEVVQKKEEQKKQNIKKTNLLMANIFKKNLQKKTLRGAVNLSNYSTVIKI